MKRLKYAFLLFPALTVLAGIELPAQVPVKTIKKQLPADSIKMKVMQTKKTGVFYVDQSSPADGDGTALKPFQKISEAMLTARLKGQAVFINIITGTYRENLEVTGNTTLNGITRSGQPEKGMGAILIGSVINRAACILEINNLRIANAAAPGALVIDNSRAKTILNNVSIDRAARYGIYQKGGTLNMNAVSVVYITPGTVSEYERQNNINEVVTYGTGIYLVNVSGLMSAVNLRGNVQGLIADGAATNVRISTMKAERHTVNALLKDRIICSSTSMPNGIACIEVSNGASLELQGIEILDNEFCGLSVRDGARVTGNNVVILRTRKVSCTGGNGRGGINASVRRGGAYLELTRFELGYADLAGLQLVNATAKCSEGKVHHNIIGVHVKEPPPDFKFEDLMDRVIYADNERNLESETLPVPDPHY